MNLPAPALALISKTAAANALHDYFLANADRGDNAANDELVEAWYAGSALSRLPAGTAIDAPMLAAQRGRNQRSLQLPPQGGAAVDKDRT